MYGYPSKAVGEACAAINAGKDYLKKRSHVHVRFYGDFYLVKHWSTVIAIGKRGEMPFAMKTDGWDTVTTRGVLSALGFSLSRKKLIIGRTRNEKTNRMNNIYESVLHINGRPMFDQCKWHDKCGFCLGEYNFNF